MESVKSRPGKFMDAQRNRMQLSTETLLGIRRTGLLLYFVIYAISPVVLSF